MSDIVRAVNRKGVIVYKAETERGKEGLGRLLGGPWQMAQEVFMHVPAESEVAVIEALNAYNVTVKAWEPPPPKKTKPVDVSTYTDF